MKPCMNIATEWWLMIGPPVANQTEGYDLEIQTNKGIQTNTFIDIKNY